MKLAGGFYKIPPDHVLVVSDDVALPLGKLRIRPEAVRRAQRPEKHHRPPGTDQFPRIRVGVGAPEHPDHEMIDWVIGSSPGGEKSGG